MWFEICSVCRLFPGIGQSVLGQKCPISTGRYFRHRWYAVFCNPFFQKHIYRVRNVLSVAADWDERVVQGAAQAGHTGRGGNGIAADLAVSDCTFEGD